MAKKKETGKSSLFKSKAFQKPLTHFLSSVFFDLIVIINIQTKTHIGLRV